LYTKVRDVLSVKRGPGGEETNERRGEVVSEYDEIWATMSKLFPELPERMTYFKLEMDLVSIPRVTCEFFPDPKVLGVIPVRQKFDILPVEGK
jgi:hypothetical protein